MPKLDLRINPTRKDDTTLGYRYGVLTPLSNKVSNSLPVWRQVRKAIEAIRAKSGGGPGVKLGARSPAIQGAGQAANPTPNAGTAVATAAAGSTAAVSAPANAGEGAAGAVAGNAAAAAPPPAAAAAGKAGKTGGKKKNRKKK